MEGVNGKRKRWGSQRKKAKAGGGEGKWLQTHTALASRARTSRAARWAPGPSVLLPTALCLALVHND